MKIGDEDEMSECVHDHNTATCESCRSSDAYTREQYLRYENQIEELKQLGDEIAANLENMHGTMTCIKAWRKAAGK